MPVNLCKRDFEPVDGCYTVPFAKARRPRRVIRGPRLGYLPSCPRTAPPGKSGALCTFT